MLQFKVREPEAAYVVDLKSGNGAIRAGSDAAAGATFEISDEDLAALSKGEASARDLYQHGKLKVLGDVRLAHKLDFMKLN